jgi:DNA-directed RNA polymerase sigma subunit (sigma70/sigma32)
MTHAAVLPILTTESGLARYFEEIRRFPMLEPQEEYMLAKCWRENGNREAALATRIFLRALEKLNASPALSADLEEDGVG